MRLLIAILLTVSSQGLFAKQIIDMVGRTVSVPDKITSVLPYDSKTSILLFPVAYDLMVAKAMLPGNRIYKFMDERYNRMPQVDVKNIEELLASSAQVIIAGMYATDSNFKRIEQKQRRTNIPVVVVDLTIDNLDKTYKFLGDLLGVSEACIKCSNFLKSVYDANKRLLEHTSEKSKLVYYTIGSSGLMTDPSGSKHTEVIDFMKLKNVAEVPIPTSGHVNVNMEQLITWNPDYILAGGFKAGKNAVAEMSSSPRWKSISAVKNNRIYKVPTQPFGWLDHPPSINRIPGVIWLGQLFYGQTAAETQKQIQAFYSLFYNYNLSESEYQSLFK